MFTLIFNPTISIKIVELISPNTFSRREIETQQNKKKRESIFMKKFSYETNVSSFVISFSFRKRVFAQLV